MNKIQRNSNGTTPRLTEVYPTIQTNTILCKTLTGLGATYSEIKAQRNSIIVEPNIPPIIGKCADSKHESDNLFGVMQGVTEDEIVDYLSTSIENHKHIKILTTPESFRKVKNAFEEIDENMYVSCFMLLDECHKLVKDTDYRPEINLPIDDFFRFDNKALVSATPILPSDPRFEQQNFTIVKITPEFPYSISMSVIPTNNVLATLTEWLPRIKESQTANRSICFFVNSTDMIHQLMQKLGILEESAVFCAKKSVDKLKRRGFRNVYENWDTKNHKPYMFFTSRFYTALDIEMEERPDIVFVTDPYFAEYSMTDPDTDMIQAIGRFRNGTSQHFHIVSTNENMPIRTREGITEYLKGCEVAYTTIQNLYECATSLETRNAYKAALDVLPYNQMIKNGAIDHFAIDNYVDEELVKSSYHTPQTLLSRYAECGRFIITAHAPLYYAFGDRERLTFNNNENDIKAKRKQVVEILESFNGERTPMIQSFIEELRIIDSFIVEAYETVGKAVIEMNNYNKKRIKEAMILKDFNVKTSGIEFVQLLKNSFKSGSVYTRSYIKKELIRLYELVHITPKEKVTAQTIQKFFNVQECKHKGNRAYRLSEAKI